MGTRARFTSKRRLQLAIAARFLAVAVVLSLSVGHVVPGAAEASLTFAFWGDPAEAAAYEQVIAGFEGQAPGTRIEAQYTPGREDYRRRITTAFVGNTPPDVFLINYREYQQYAAAGALEPLGPQIENSDAISENDFYELPLDAFRSSDGELICIPQNISSLVVYYNADLFDTAGIARPTSGWTLDDFLAAAKALTRDIDGDGAIDVHGLVTDSSLVRYAPFIWMHGGEIVNNPDQPTRLLLDSPESRQGIKWFTDLGVEGHNVVPTEAEVLAEDNLSRFMDGRAAMMFDSRRIVPTLREIDRFVWDVAPLPQGQEEVGILHSDAFCMSATASDKEAAWRFIEYAAGPHGQQILAATGRTVPSLKSVAESPAFLVSNKSTDAPGDGINAFSPASARIFLDTIPNLRSLPTFSTWAEIEDIFNAEFQRSLYGGFDVDRALSNVNKNAQDAIRRAAEEDVSKSHIEPLWVWNESSQTRLKVSGPLVSPV
jgi:multiple sugar transport system substrate-binding protein